MLGSRNRIASDIQTNETFPARETNPTDYDKLEGNNIEKYPAVSEEEHVLKAYVFFWS